MFHIVFVGNILLINAEFLITLYTISVTPTMIL
jgi:hypothetical protein